MRGRQGAGEIAANLDPAFVLLALQAIVAAGVVFPADVRRVTGLEPSSETFAAWQAEQLRTLIEMLAEKDTGDDTPAGAEGIS